MDAARRPSRAHGDKPTNTESLSSSPAQLAAPESADLNELRCEWRAVLIAVSRQGSAATC